MPVLPRQEREAHPEALTAHAAPLGPARRLEAAFVAAASLLALAFWIRLPHTLPSEDDYRAAATRVARDFGPGDVVVLSPAWAERFRSFLDVGPVMAWPRPDREDFRRVRRVWLVGLPDAPRSEYDKTARSLGERLRRVVAAERFGHAAVALFENPQPREPLFDFGAQVASAQVSLGTEACPWDGRAHRCRGPGWVYVANELHELEFLPRRCLWAHPAGAVPLEIRFPAASVGRVLDLRAGNASQVAWRQDPAWGPVTLTAYVARKRVGSMTVEVADGTRHEIEIDTSAFAGSTQEVAFAVAADRPGNRHFCFEATAW